MGTSQAIATVSGVRPMRLTKAHYLIVSNMRAATGLPPLSHAETLALDARLNG